MLWLGERKIKEVFVSLCMCHWKLNLQVILKALLCILNCYTFRALIQDSLYNFVKVFRNFRCLEIKLFICYCVCIVKDGKFDIEIYFSFVFDLLYPWFLGVLFEKRNLNFPMLDLCCTRFTKTCWSTLSSIMLKNGQTNLEVFTPQDI